VPNGLPRRLSEQSGDYFRTIFERFRGRPGVRTKKARPLRNTGRSDRIRRPGVPRATQKRLKIAPGASRERRSEKIAQKRRLESARAPFLTDLGRFGLVFGSSWVSFASFFGSRASPGVLRARPGSPRITPEAPRTLPERSGVDFGSVLHRFSLVFGRFFLVRFGCVRSFVVRVCCVCSCACALVRSIVRLRTHVRSINATSRCATKALAQSFLRALPLRCAHPSTPSIS